MYEDPGLKSFRAANRILSPNGGIDYVDYGMGVVFLYSFQYLKRVGIQGVYNRGLKIAGRNRMPMEY